jgi:hypothetical protein
LTTPHEIALWMAEQLERKAVGGVLFADHIPPA